MTAKRSSSARKTELRKKSSAGGVAVASSGTAANGQPPPDSPHTVVEHGDAWEIRSSRIHNRGIFARRDIEEEERIMEYVGERITKAESNRRGLVRYDQSQRDGSAAVYIFELNKRHDIDGDVPWNPGKYANHSCEPNCEVRNIRGHLWMIALRPITQGEELTYDYGYDMEHFLEHPCKCGAPSCPGYIVRADRRNRVRRILAKMRQTPGKAKGKQV